MSHNPKKLKFKKPTGDKIEFMYYPDVDSEKFYPHVWSKKEFLENRSLAREYHEDPKKKKTLLKKICSPDVLKLKNHQIFLRNFLSPETPYNSILVFHGVGTGKCLLPETEVQINSNSRLSIKQIWEKFRCAELLNDGEGEWSDLSQIVTINTYDQSTQQIVTYPINRLYRQWISEKVRVLELVDGKIIRMTLLHHLLTENSWSNDFVTNQFVYIVDHQNQPKLVKIAQVYEEYYEGYVYDLEVETHHNYVANEIICHNTCAGVTIAEGLKDTVEKYNKKIYVIANTLLQGNFRSTLYNISREKTEKYPGSLQCTKTTYYIPPKKKESIDERRQREKAIREMQKKYYEYMGYIAFVHYVDKEVLGKGYDLGEFFDNSVFIIDEAHNLIARSGSKTAVDEQRKTRQKLLDIFKVSKNTKLIMLTATPITNEIDDIVVLINLLRANDHRRIYKSYDLSTDGSSRLTRHNLNLAKFSDYIKGYISYFRGAHPSSFPVELPQSNYNRRITADMFGDNLDAKRLPNFKELGLVTCEMSYFHFYNYFKNNMILERNSIGGIRSRDSQGDQLKIQATTSMYPLEAADDERIGTYDINDVFIKEKSKGRIEKYKYRTKERFLDISSRNEKYLHDKKSMQTADQEVGWPLAKYSTKFYQMFYDAVNTFGINFIFTRYRTNVGTIPISLLLEQNGYVRYHANLGKPNEFTGKYREGVNNHLDIRDVKYRCICGYLDEEHNPRYQGSNDYRHPKKHRFLQGTYLRVDGETADNFEIHRKELNSSENKYGQIIKVIVGGQNMREGVDLKFVRSVHIMNPWHNLIQIEQTIGRAIRLCSHAELDSVDDMNVRVFKYISIPPQTKLPSKWSLDRALIDLEDEGQLDLDGVKFRNRTTWRKNIKIGDVGDWESVDEHIYARALNKDYNIKFAERLMKQAAIDCYLNRMANLTFPNDKDGSRSCDYTTCHYECNFKFKPPEQVNLDTYDLYFMEPKVQEAQEVIGDLFSRNWALTLESVVSLAKRQEVSLSRDIIYLALNQMLGDPPMIKPAPVLDQFGRYGYLIYRHPFYVYQPKEVIDENLPIYNRQVPSKPSRREIDIKDLIKPKKMVILLKKPIRKSSPSNRLGNLAPTSELQMSQGRFSTQIENLLAPIQGQDIITLAGILDYLGKKQHEYLLRTRIEDICNQREINQMDRDIISYYMENFILGNTRMIYDEFDEVKNVPKGGIWVYNLAGHFWTYNCQRQRWIEIHEDSEIMIKLKERQESRYGPQFLKIQRELSPKLYGYLYDDNKKKEIKFKIRDVEGEDVKTKRYSEEINIKTKTRGQVCGNYSNDQLENICDRLKIRYDDNLQRNSLCSLIERELRIRDMNDPEFMWFMNFYNFKRKFDHLEDVDIRSLFNFYRS